jgi:hypothetical protein
MVLIPKPDKALYELHEAYNKHVCNIRIGNIGYGQIDNPIDTCACGLVFTDSGHMFSTDPNIVWASEVFEFMEARGLLDAFMYTRNSQWGIRLAEWRRMCQTIQS